MADEIGATQVAVAGIVSREAARHAQAVVSSLRGGGAPVVVSRREAPDLPDDYDGGARRRGAV